MIFIKTPSAQSRSSTHRETTFWTPHRWPIPMRRTSSPQPTSRCDPSSWRPSRCLDDDQAVDMAMSLIIWLWVKSLVLSEPKNRWDLWMFIPFQLIIMGFWPTPISMHGCVVMSSWSRILDYMMTIWIYMDFSSMFDWGFCWPNSIHSRMAINRYRERESIFKKNRRINQTKWWYDDQSLRTTVSSHF